MLRNEKAQQVDFIKDRFARMSSAVFVDYTGMTVAQVSKLRDTFRARGIEYKVVKNTLLKLAIAEESYGQELGKSLKGMTAVAWSFEEPSAAARVLKDFIKENEKPGIKGGLLDGQVLNSTAVTTQLATLPSKDEARAMLLATMMAPAQHFVRLINEPASAFVRVLDAKQQKG
jgi:large subunit ribosomal protein L10